MYEKNVPIAGIDPVTQINRANLLFHREVILRRVMMAHLDGWPERSETQWTAGRDWAV